jgi:hypothetical protein
VLRRFEIYTMAEGAAPEKVLQLEEAFRRCGDFIPEMTHSVVGKNLSDVDVDMVWEHGYASPEAYQRYMVHPFHANILDRYLLNDCPERIVGNSPLGDGTLVGYACDGPVYLMHDGTRKVVLSRALTRNRRRSSSPCAAWPDPKTAWSSRWSSRTRSEWHGSTA